MSPHRGTPLLHFTLARTRTTKDSLLGELYGPQKRECFTLENRALAIPVGTYAMSLFQSPRFRTLVPLLHDVPGRSFIEIHYGNTFKDTEGCILVGQVQGSANVGRSRAAFEALIVKMQEHGGPFSITVLASGSGVC